MSRRAVACLLVLALALAGGCSGQPAAQPETPDPAEAGGVDAPDSPLATCDGLTEPPAGTGETSGADETPSGTADSATSSELPELTLPCFTGGDPVTLSELKGPAVVNLWASWCPPCREELPHLQRFADQAAGQVHVLGVVTEDRRSAAASLATDLGISFPALEDPDRELLGATAAVGLPATFFLTESGEIAYLHQGSAGLDEPAIRAQVAEHLGVRVGESG